MKSICFVFLALFIAGTAFWGCTSSLVYSPSMNLSPRPLKKGQSQLLGGVGYFPETRPHEIDAKTAFGGESTYRYAICDHFALQAKGWYDFSDNIEVNRFGFSSSIIAMLNDSSNLRYGLMPTGAFVFGDNEVEGGGGGLFLAFWYTRNHPIDLYTTLGPAFAIRDISGDNKEWGWGILLNAGIGVLIKNHLTLNLEVAGIKQVNEHDDIKDYFICPSFNVGYIFDK